MNGTPLTSRQWQVAALLAKGFNDAEAGRILGLSRRTIGWHSTRIYARLGVKNRAQLSIVAQQQGIVVMTPEGMV